MAIIRGMRKSSARNEPTGYPEFGVRKEDICAFFSLPMPSSTFHDRVNEGIIVPIKGMRGFYKLNDSLRRLGLREVPELPQKITPRTTEETRGFFAGTRRGNSMMGANLADFLFPHGG